MRKLGWTVSAPALMMVSWLASAVAGQTAAGPNFTGVFEFSPQRSQLQIPAPSSSTFRLDHQGATFKLSRTHVYDGKPDTWGIELTIGGPEVEEPSGGQTTRARAYWQGSDLVFDSTITIKDRRATNVVTYRLSEDGRTLTAKEVFRGPIVKYDNVWVFEKK